MNVGKADNWQSGFRVCAERERAIHVYIVLPACSVADSFHHYLAGVWTADP